MSETGRPNGNEQGGMDVQQLRIQIVGQYVKDLSFENPGAPMTGAVRPQIDLGVDVQARRLGEEVVRVANGIQNTTNRVVLWGASSTIVCPGRKPDPSVAPAPAAASPVATGNGAVASPTAGQDRRVKMVDGDPVSIPLELVMINDIALANVGGEVFNEISQKLKQHSLFDRTAMVTLSPGSIGYIPSEKSYLLPSQMAVNNHIKPGCAEQSIVNGFLDLEKQYLPVWNAAR